MGCRPVSSRLITIHLRAVPFNITIVQAYAPTSDYDDNEIEEFYDQLQNVIDQTPTKDILVAQGDWNAKVGWDVCGNCQGICGPFCNEDTNERGLRLLEFATFNVLVLANRFGHHKTSRRWTWHSPNGQHHNQIDYILVRKRFRSGVNIARTRSFPWADIGSDDDLLMIFFFAWKKSASQNTKDSSLTSKSWKIPTCWKPSKFAPLTIMSNEDTDIDSMITTFNTAVTETAGEILGKHRQKKQNPGSLQKFLICATKGENWERKDLSLKDQKG